MSSVISVLAKLKADTTSYVNGMKAADKATEAFKKGTKDAAEKTVGQSGKMGQAALKMGTIVKGAVIGFLTVQTGQFLKGAISQASAFQAEFEGVNQTFGDGAAKVQEFAAQAAYSAGLAETTALRFAKSFGGYAKSAGKAGDEAADFATQMVQAAGDLGSFYDLPTESALMAIQQGLRGEYEPLRRFNILLDEATIGQKAMTMGISGTGKNLTQQEKILVRQTAIMEGLGVAQGDFVKYSDDYGNAIKTTSALFENLQQKVGAALLPAMASLAKAVVPLIERLGPLLTTAIEKLAPVIETVAGLLDQLIPVITPLLDVVGILAEVIASLVDTIFPPLLAILTPILDLFAQLMVPIGELVKAFGGAFAIILEKLAPAFQNLFAKAQPIIDIFMEMAGTVGDSIGSIAPFIGDLFVLILELAGAFFMLMKPIYKVVQKLLPVLLKLVEKLLPILVSLVEFWLTLLMPVLEHVFTQLGNTLNFIADVVVAAVNLIIDGLNMLLPYVEPILNNMIEGINSVLRFLGIKEIPKLPKNLKLEAFAQGEELGNAFANGLTGTKPPAVTGVETGTGTGTGEQKKNPVTEFYAKIAEDIKKQQAKIKLISMGMNDQLIDMVMSSGDGWEKVYKSIVKGGSKAIDALGKKFAQTGAGMEKVSEMVSNTMEGIQSSIMGAFDVSKMGNSSKQIMSNARKLVERAKAFGMEIAALSKKKLNPTLLNQVIAAGPVEGLALARSLNTSDIGELNSLYSQIGNTALSTGKEVAKSQTQYIVNVQAGVGDKNTIGKAVIESIKAYERTSGTSWRTS